MAAVRFKSLGLRSRSIVSAGHWPFAIALVFSALPFGAGPSGAAEGSGLRQFMLLLLFLMAGIAIIRFPERFHLIGKAFRVPLLLMLIYILMSCLWSPAPYVSLKRVIQVIGVFVLCMAIVVGGNGRPRVSTVAGWSLVTLMVLSALVAGVFTNYSFADNGFRGVTANKNTFGQLCSMAIILSAYNLSVHLGRRLHWWMLATVALLGLIASRSGTSIVAIGLVVVLLGSIYLIRNVDKSWHPPMLVASMVVILIFFALAINYSDIDAEFLLNKLLATSGKDITLSGRTYLWELMFSEFEKNKWFGLGFGSFWLGMEGSSGQIAYLVKWGYPGQAHNGYLDLLNELGVTGMVLFGTVVVWHTSNIRRLGVLDKNLALFHLAILLLVVILNFAETTFLRTTHVWWMLFVASMLEVSCLVNNSQMKGFVSSRPHRRPHPKSISVA